MSQQNPNEIGSQIPQQAFDWYDEYTHGDINRRTFLSRLASLSLVGLTFGAVNQALTPNK
jgi:carboxymethylenebutenolidase